MSRLKRLQDRDAAITNSLRLISDTAESDGRDDLTSEEQKQFDDLAVESKTVLAALKIEETIQSSEKRLARVPDRNAPTSAEKLALSLKTEDDFQKLKVISYSNSASLAGFSGEGVSRQESQMAAYRAGQWARATIYDDHRAKSYCHDHGIGGYESLATSSAHSFNVTSGGIFVPEELSSAFIRLREQFGVFRQNCAIWPMSTETLMVPRSITDLTAYFVSQNSDTTASEATFDGVQLVAKELAALTRLPYDLAEDAIIDLASLLATSMAFSFAKKEDQVGFNGTGLSTEGGIQGITTLLLDSSHTAGKITAGATRTGFETLTLVDFHSTMAKLPQYAMSGAKWYISSFGYATSMQRLEYAAGGNTAPIIANGVPVQMFLGYPVVISQVLNATAGADASKIACLFGDMKMSSSLGARREFRIDSSRERYFEFRQIGIQGTERFDINNHDLGDTTDAGPVVALQKAAS